MTESKSAAGAVQSQNVPVVVLSGFLGAGKTTLLRKILANTAGRRVAVVVNDMAEVNIDSAMVGHELVQRPAEIVEFQNGCICCTLRQDLLEEVARLARTQSFDAIVVESTGVANPMEVAETFSFPVDETTALNDIARLDLAVTVVDASVFWQNFTSVQRLRQRHASLDVEDDRNVVQLMLDQIEFADLVLLNKRDMVTETQIVQMTAIVQALNRHCEVLPCIRGDIPITKLLHTGVFSMSRAAKAKGWLQSLMENNVPETERYGISSFVYRQRRPFHPERFFKWASKHWVFEDSGSCDSSGDEQGTDEKIDEDLDAEATRDSTEAARRDRKLQATAARCREALGTILRSKGFVWLATRPHLFGTWNQVGSMAELDRGCPWFVEVPEDAWPASPEDRAAIRNKFEGSFGDRRQELVFIGQDVKRDAVCRSLDECLLNAEEFAAYAAAAPRGPVALLPLFADPLLPWEEPPDLPEDDNDAVDTLDEPQPTKRQRTAAAANSDLV